MFNVYYRDSLLMQLKYDEYELGLMVDSKMYADVLITENMSALRYLKLLYENYFHELSMELFLRDQ